MFRMTLCAIGVTLGLAGAAGAAVVSPVFTDEGIDSSGTAAATRMYRADLTGLGLSEINSITIKDSNSGLGGSPGIYSGFDLDAIFLDLDGSLATAADRFFANSFQFSAGALRPGGALPPSPSGGPTNGSTSPVAVDEAFATLNDIDGVFFGPGSLTLGDGGSLSAVFDPKVLVGPSLYLFVGEVSGDAGETVTGLVEVSDRPPELPPVPLPASAWLLLTGLGLAAGLRGRGGPRA